MNKRIGSLAIVLTACALEHVSPTVDPKSPNSGSFEPSSVEYVPTSSPAKYVPEVAPSEVSQLERCLLDGGRLQVARSVNNNDTMNHGEITALAVSDERTVAVSSASTIKLWDFSSETSELDGVLREAEFAYGLERPGGATALAWEDESLLAATSAGVVNRWHREGELFWAEPVGGASPGIPLRDLAISPDQQSLAYASEEGVVIRTPTKVVTIPRSENQDVQRIKDAWHVAFAGDDALVIAGANGTFIPAALEWWSISSETMLDSVSLGHDLGVAIASAQDESRVAVVGANHTIVFDAPKIAIVEEQSAQHDGSADASLAELSSTGAVLFYRRGITNELSIQIRDVENNRALSSFVYSENNSNYERESIVSMVRDPKGEYLFVAQRGGMIHALSCQ